MKVDELVGRIFQGLVLMVFVVIPAGYAVFLGLRHRYLKRLASRLLSVDRIARLADVGANQITVWKVQRAGWGGGPNRGKLREFHKVEMLVDGKGKPGNHIIRDVYLDGTDDYRAIEEDVAGEIVGSMAPSA